MRKNIDLEPKIVTLLQHKAIDKGMTCKPYIEDVLNNHARNVTSIVENFTYPILLPDDLPAGLKSDYLELLELLKDFDMCIRIYVLNKERADSISIFSDQFTSTVLQIILTFCKGKLYSHWISPRCVDGVLYCEFFIYK